MLRPMSTFEQEPEEFNLHAQDLDRVVKSLARAMGILDTAREYVSESDSDVLGAMETALLGIVARMERRVEAGEMEESQ